MAKKPWEMTRAEYQHIRAREYLAAGYDNTDANRAAKDDVAIHRAAVKIALDEGKPVPKEVLRGYPELQHRWAAVQMVKLRRQDEQRLTLEPPRLTTANMRVKAGVAYTDKGRQRLSRKRHKGFRRFKLS